MNKNRENYNDVIYFKGLEIEYTPAFNKMTLFVVGNRAPQEIDQFATQEKINHIYLGTSGTFEEKPYWSDTIFHLLAKGYMVTLDYPVQSHDYLVNNLDERIWNNKNFIPMVSCKLPHLAKGNPNLTIKIDDKDFGLTNPGVWCSPLKTLTDPNRFTSWDLYKDDVILLKEPK